MKFYPIYYFTIACPTIEKTMEMIDLYVEKSNIRGIQIDMPSTDPYGETDFVKAKMANALKEYDGYATYMDAIKSIRQKHPNLELHIVVYPDVIDAIGIDVFTSFCSNIKAFTVRIAGTETIHAYIAYLNEHGVVTSDCINYSMPEDDINRCRNTKGIIHMRSKRKTEAPNKGLETWEQRLAYVRGKGVTARIFATADITTAEELITARDSGADGAYIGNVLMRLWDDTPALLSLLASMEATAA